MTEALLVLVLALPVLTAAVALLARTPRQADMANVAGREAGAVTAACFLWKFTDGLSWAHLDIAGSAYLTGTHKGSTGRPVPLLVDWLLQGA